MFIQPRTSISLATLAGLVATAGCPYTFVREDHCLNQDGDAYCQRRFGDDAAFCGMYECVDRLPDYNNEGCVPEKPAELECWSPCGDRMSALEDDSCLDGVADDSSSGSDSGDPTGDPDTSAGTVGETESGDEETTTGVPACDGDADCVDEAAPFCGDAGECVACDAVADGDAACAAKFTDLGICNSGACVECTTDNASACSGTSPICDEGTFSCGPCTAHEQCAGSEACSIAAGSCFPESSVVTVDGDGPADYGSLTEALADRNDPELVIILHAAASYDEAVTIDGRVVAIFAAEDESPRLINSNTDDPILTIQNGAAVYLKGIDFQDASAQGVVINDANAYIEQCAIVGNDGGGITVTNSGYLKLVNCFVGGDVSDVAAIETSGSTFDILYSTVIGGFGDATALTCTGAAGSTVRNSLLAARTDTAEVACNGPTFENNALEAPLGGNVDLPNVATDWFAGFAAGEFYLTQNAPAAIATAARWRIGDPATDIDGTPRPETDDTPDYAGADRPD